MGAEALVGVKLLRAGARMPSRGTDLASGFDLYACLGAETVELSQVPTLVPTGLALEVPPGFDAQIRPPQWPRAPGILSTFGTLDADYRGELMVALYTTSPEVHYTVRDGDRIGQLVITHLADVAFVTVEALSETARGVRGHGSTGR